MRSDVVEDLIETCRDGQKGYQDAAEKVKRTDLKAFFNRAEPERPRFAEELQAELDRDWASRTRRFRIGRRERCTGPGSIRKSRWAAGTSRSSNRWKHGEDSRQRRYQKALTGELPSTTLRRLCVDRRPACSGRMTGEGCAIRQRRRSVRRSRSRAKISHGLTRIFTDFNPC